MNRKIFQLYNIMPTTAKNKTFVSTESLAENLAVTRQTITSWRKQYPDCPQRTESGESYTKWLAWLKKHPEANQSNNSRKSGKRYNLECEQLRIKIQIARIELAETQARYVTIADVRLRDDLITKAVKRALGNMPSLIPQIQGKDATELVGVFDQWTHKTLTDLSDIDSALWRGIV